MYASVTVSIRTTAPLVTTEPAAIDRPSAARQRTFESEFQPVASQAVKPSRFCCVNVEVAKPLPMIESESPLNQTTFVGKAELMLGLL